MDGNQKAEAWAVAIGEYFGLTPPVDVEGLAARLGIDIVRERLSRKFDGVIVEEDSGRYVMIINSRHHITRQRFTIAHEIGHWLMHRRSLENLGVSLRLQRRRRYNIEREANAFAAALLMPRDDVIRSFHLGLSFQELVKRYAVSRQSLGYRLQELGLIPAEDYA